jgi:hypothetical protein
MLGGHTQSSMWRKPLAETGGSVSGTVCRCDRETAGTSRALLSRVLLGQAARYCAGDNATDNHLEPLRMGGNLGALIPRGVYSRHGGA